MQRTGCSSLTSCWTAWTGTSPGASIRFARRLRRLFVGPCVATFSPDAAEARAAQATGFGAFLDVCIDNLSRGALWTSAGLGPFAAVATGAEWLAFVCLHKVSSLAGPRLAPVLPTLTGLGVMRPVLLALAWTPRVSNRDRGAAVTSRQNLLCPPQSSCGTMLHVYAIRPGRPSTVRLRRLLGPAVCQLTYGDTFRLEEQHGSRVHSVPRLPGS